MDPLSAYRAALPGYSPVAMPKLPEDSAKIIPRAELDKLSSSVLQPTGVTPNLSPNEVTPGTSFGGMMDNLVSEVSGKQAAAGAAMRSVMTDGKMPLHQAMIAVQEANVSFQLMVEVRNKLLESYQELMRMQV